MVDLPASDRPQAPRSIFSAVGLTFVGQTGIVLFGALSAIISARLLGVAGKGQFNTLLVAAGVIGLLIEMGLRATAIYMVASGRLTWKEALATLLLLYGAVCTVVLPVGAFCIYHAHAQLFPGIPAVIQYLALASVPMLLAEGAVTGVLAGHQRLPEASAVQTLEKIVFILGLVGLVWLFHGGIFGAVIASIGGLLLGCFTGMLLLARMPGGRVRVRRDLIPDFFRFGSVVYIANLAMSLNYRFDSLLVFHIKHDVQAGLYAIAVSLAEMTQNVPNAMSAVLYPSVSGDTVNAGTRTGRLLRMTIIILVISCVLLVAVGYPLIGLFFGDQFRPSYLPMVMLLPGMISIGCSRILAADIVGRGYPKYAAIAAWIALIATLLLDLLLIPRWGIFGAAFASSVSYTISVIVLTTVYHRLTGISIRELFIPRRVELLEMAGRLRQLVRRYHGGRQDSVSSAE